MRTPADGRGGSTPPRPPVTGTPQQRFVLRSWVFDVTAAIGLLRAAPRPLQLLPVGPWACAYGLIPAPGGSTHTVSLIGPGPDFDPEYAMGTDLDEPVIIATITSPAGDPGRATADRRLPPPGEIAYSTVASSRLDRGRGCARGSMAPGAAADGVLGQPSLEAV